MGNQNIGGGNAHSIGIETSVAEGDDILKIWHRTAKLTAELSKEYNLPHGHVKFHQDFSSMVSTIDVKSTTYMGFLWNGWFRIQIRKSI